MIAGVWDNRGVLNLLVEGPRVLNEWKLKNTSSQVSLALIEINVVFTLLNNLVWSDISLVWFKLLE